MSAPPSPFAALLRRSKFASFDPCIGQVYTTHGGHAHRGNWGLKRPLPNRRQTGFITVRSIDSPEQQTEWSSAEASARWIRRWEEQGKSLNSLELGGWFLIAKKSTSPDSQFSRIGKPSLEPISEEGSVHDLPEVNSMTERQFQKYLEHLRALRPEFKEFLYQYAQHVPKEERSGTRRKLPSEKVGGRNTLKLTGSGQVDMYASAAIGHEVHAKRFLTWLRTRELYASKSKALARQPHHFAGLEYTRLSDLQAQYLHRPVIGRNVMQNHAASHDHGKSVLVPKAHYIAAGGVVGSMPSTAAGNLVTTDYGTQETPRRHRDHGVSYFRMTRALLADPPTVVGRVPQGITHTAQKTNRADQRSTVRKTHLSHVEFWPTTQENTNRSNPYPMGSPDYIAKGDSYSPMMIPGKMKELSIKAHVHHSPSKNIISESSMQMLAKLDVMIKQPR